MRAARLALIAVAALCVTPVVAQGKAKVSLVAPSLQLLSVCESFASEDPAALETAIAQGWDAYDQGGESPFVRSYGGSKEIAGLGYADFFVLVESYPDRTFGYCRADVIEPTGDGEVLVKAIVDQGRYTGEFVQDDKGSYASLGDTGGDQDRLLLTHWTKDAFVVQLTINTPKAETAEQSNGAVPPAGETAPSAQTTEEK